VKLAALTLAALAIAGAAMATPAPKVSIASLAQLPTPLPSPYDAAANAQADVAAARETARREHKLLLIDLGGDWCGDCRVLAGILRLPEVASFVQAHYVLVNVNVGHMNRNLDVPGRYGVTRLDGVPSLLVVDAHGRLRDAGHVDALADARHMTPQGLADWLAKWTD
jgi:thiol-disulfide isomerase/thioredoxin